MPIAASFALSLAINSALFFSADRALGPEARWHRPQALELVAANRPARKIELEFVEAPPQKPVRKPERTSKIAARDTLAQDASPLKTQASLAPAVKNLGPADQLAQRRMEDRPVLPLRAPEPVQPRPTVPKEPAPPRRPETAQVPAEGQSWLPIRAATTQAAVPQNPQGPEEAERAQEKALDQAIQLTSKDKITTVEMAVKRSSGAPFQGVTSFEATGSGMGAYMKNLKDKIWLEWFPYIAFRYPVNFETADAVVSFKLGKYGEIKSVEVIDYRGSPMFATFCMQAVRRSGGFGPLPADLLAMMGKDELEIKFAFHYR